MDRRRHRDHRVALVFIADALPAKYQCAGRRQIRAPHRLRRHDVVVGATMANMAEAIAAGSLAGANGRGY